MAARLLQWRVANPYIQYEDYQKHRKTVADRDRYRNVDLEPPPQDVLKLVQLTYLGRQARRKREQDVIGRIEETKDKRKELNTTDTSTHKGEAERLYCSLGQCTVTMYRTNVPVNAPFPMILPWRPSALPTPMSQLTLSNTILLMKQKARWEIR
jgi:hypothetical protein